MNLPTAVIAGYKKIFVLQGRASRSEFWYFYLANALLIVFLSAATYDLTRPWPSASEPPAELDPFFFIVGSIFSTVLMFATVRRLHDLNLSGWWVVTAFSRLTLLPLLVVCCLRGSSGNNKYGEDPRTR